MEEALLHAAEFRRCLIQMDVGGMLKLWAHVAPHLGSQSLEDALISIHIARCEMKSIDPKLRLYSQDWLLERGYRKIDGKWVSGPPPEDAITSCGRDRGQIEVRDCSPSHPRRHGRRPRERARQGHHGSPETASRDARGPRPATLPAANGLIGRDPWTTVSCSMRHFTPRWVLMR